MDTLAGPLRRKSTMSTRSLYRRHSPQSKLPLCADIRDGKIGRREAKRTYPISANRIQLWLSQYDRGELNAEEAAATTISESGAKIAALERKVGSLAMEIDLLKKTTRLRPESSNKPSFIISGPLPAGSNGGVRCSNSQGALFMIVQAPPLPPA